MQPRPCGRFIQPKRITATEIPDESNSPDESTNTSGDEAREVVSVRGSTQITGPLCISSPTSYILSEPSIVAPLLQIPLESRRLTRVCKRWRQQSRNAHLSPGLTERLHGLRCLPLVADDESTEFRIDNLNSVPIRLTAKRKARALPCIERITVPETFTNILEVNSNNDMQLDRRRSQWEETSIIATNYDTSVIDNDGSRLQEGVYLATGESSFSTSMQRSREVPCPLLRSAIPDVSEGISENANCVSRGSVTDSQSLLKTESSNSRNKSAATPTPFSRSTSIGCNARQRLCAIHCASMTQLSANVLKVANRVIKYARDTRITNEESLRCPDCNLFPTLPVTGQCGHTRCTKCIDVNGACPCGVQSPENLHVNTVIQDLIGKLLPHKTSTRVAAKLFNAVGEFPPGLPPDPFTVSLWRPHRSLRRRHLHHAFKTSSADVHLRLPMSPKVRLEYARWLVAEGRHLEAAPHLAKVAASCESMAKPARSLLNQTIAVLSEDGDPRRLTRDLYRAIRNLSPSLTSSDLECILCVHTYTRPVTTPCGHTYCRTCVERSLDYRKTCALCLRTLQHFNLAETRDTEFVCAALESIDALNPPPPPDPDVIPIFVCTVAFPAIPCPLFIFDPRYWLMIRRVLESGSRKFGMVAYERDRTFSDYGTVLEVRDCVHLEDGRSILSTVGVSRFRIIEREVRDGCDVARIQPLTDVTPTEQLALFELRLLATQISYKAIIWLNGMSKTVRSEIETAFGSIPAFERGDDWWQTADGPAWLWWLIAILPLRSEIKVLILSTNSLLKRVMAVSRTFEAMDQVALTAKSTDCELQNALTNADEWLDRPRFTQTRNNNM